MSKNYSTTFTVTIADPAVFTATEHGLYIDDRVTLTTTGALPTGLTANAYDTPSAYYVIADGISVNTFQLAESPRGSAVITTGTQSGAHTFRKTEGNVLTPMGVNFI